MVEYNKTGNSIKDGYFEFRELTPSQNLQYERLTLENYHHLYNLFANDPSPFVIKEFKSENSVRWYTNHVISMAASTDCAGCDFFIKTADGKYAGIVHLYDLNFKQVVEESTTDCTIGYGVAAAFRGKGIASEAVKHLIEYIYTNLPVKSIRVFTDQKNQASIALISKLGFLCYGFSFNVDASVHAHYLLTKEHS